jgi:hypothetical protein
MNFLAVAAIHPFVGIVRRVGIGLYMLYERGWVGPRFEFRCFGGGFVHASDCVV